MPIFYSNESKEFHLQGKNVSYILNILRNSQLGHLYYGKKLRHRDSFNHLYREEYRDNGTNVFEGDQTFALDTLKQEIPAYGTTDFREPVYQILQENGSRITNVEYQEHKIYKEKPSLEGLPATYLEDENEATTLEITL